MQLDEIEDISHSSDSSQYFAVIIANPTSGNIGFPHPNRHFDETLAFLRKQGWKAEIWHTQSAGDGENLARKAVEQQVNLVIAAGGDGTINEIIQGLAGSETALGVLPSGTVNVWARELGIPLDDARARNVLVNGQTRRIDLGCINGRYFLLMVGIGFDGEVTQAVEGKPLKRLGILGYTLAVLWLGPGYRGFPVVAQIDKYVVKTRALQIFVGNTQLYAGAVKFTWQAKVDDGLLDLCIVRKRNMWGRLVVARDFILRRSQRRLWVRYDTFKTLKIETPSPIPYQIDGEAGGYTPAELNVAPGVLKVIVPQKTPRGLFTKDAVNTHDTNTKK
ncbi:MAG: diacylglycerol/lipid kinase family protein [Ktedonobacteraceae bacterium]